MATPTLKQHQVDVVADAIEEANTLKAIRAKR